METEAGLITYMGQESLTTRWSSGLTGSPLRPCGGLGTLLGTRARMLAWLGRSDGSVVCGHVSELGGWMCLLVGRLLI